MTDIRSIHTDHAPAAIGAYSQAVVVDGWVFCSGQIPIDPVSGELNKGTVTEQTELVLTNLKAVLEAAGSSMSHVVKTTVFLSDMNTFAEMNAVYAKFFGDHRPARAAVQAGALPKFCDVEIECVARVSS